MCNRLIHAYLGIDNHTLCSIVVTDVPARLPTLRAVRQHSVRCKSLACQRFPDPAPRYDVALMSFVEDESFKRFVGERVFAITSP